MLVDLIKKCILFCIEDIEGISASYWRMRVKINLFHGNSLFLILHRSYKTYLDISI